MKKYFLLCIVMLLFFNNQLGAQKIKKERTTSSVSKVSAEELNKMPFTQRNWEFIITKPNLAFSHQNIRANGIDQGSQTNFLLDVGTHYYVVDHFGIGAEFYMNNSTAKNNGNKQTQSTWMGYVDFTGGINVTSDVNFYARFGVGTGGVVNKYTPSVGQSTKNKSDLFGYKFSLGGPIRLERNGNTYLTPEIGYFYNREKFDGGTETDNRFGLGIKLETFLSCDKASCEATSSYRTLHDMYAPGRSFLGVSTDGGFYFGNTTTKYNMNLPVSKLKYSQVDLSVNYNYYFIKNLSGGLDINFSNSVFKNSMTDYRQTNTAFSIAPMLELNLPVENHSLNDLFIRGGYSFGALRSEYKSGNFTNTTKYSVGNFCAGLGYNFFFKKGLSLTPIFEYDWTTYKNKDNDQKEKYNGPDFSIGVRKFFR